jgi:peptide/nickel transport system permease protein
MIPFIVRRLGMTVLMFILVSMLIFGLTQVLPGDVTTMVLGRFASEESKAELRSELGLDRSLPVQYGTWLADFARGDWGTSVSLRSDIGPLIWERLVNSAYLAFVGLLMFAPLGIVLGLFAGLRRGTWIDNSLSIGSLAFIGLPEFVTGLVLMSLFAIRLGWLPASSTIPPGASFFEILPKLILPGMTVALTSLAYVIRMTRASTVEVMKTDYVRTARLKGLPPHKVLFGHVLRNALLPTVTVIAVSIGWLVGGLIITESLFGYPGLGRLVLSAIQRRDLPLIQATTMVIVVIVMLSNLAADIIYAYLNPRIRY